MASNQTLWQISADPGTVDYGYLQLAAAVLSGLAHEYSRVLQAYQRTETLDAAVSLRAYEEEIRREFWHYSALSMGLIESPEWYIMQHRRRYGLEQIDLDAEIAYIKRKMFIDATQ